MAISPYTNEDESNGRAYFDFLITYGISCSWWHMRLMKRLVLIPLLILALLAGTGSGQESPGTSADHSPDVVGRRLVELGNYQEAADYFRQVLVREPDNVEACVSLGTALCKLDRAAPAMKAFGDCLERMPGNTSLLIARGLCEQNSGARLIGLAEADYKRALLLSPENASAHNQLGIIYQARGDHHAAMPEFQAAIDSEPGFSVAYNNLGASLIALGRYEEAIAIIQKSIAASPDLKGITLYTNLGIALLYAGKIPRAEAAFLLEASINPDHIEAHLNLGNLYTLSNRNDEAKYEYLRVLMSDPDNKNALINLGAVYATSGEAAKAKKHLEKATALYPDSALAHHYLGVAYKKSGNNTRAWEMESKAKELGYKPDRSPWPVPSVGGP